MANSTVLFWIVTVFLVTVSSCSAFETYCREKTDQEYIKKGYVERQVGKGIWDKRWEWVKEKE